MSHKRQNQTWQMLRYDVCSFVCLLLFASTNKNKVDFFDSYTRLMRSYSKNFDTANITFDLMDFLQPPTELFVEVRGVCVFCLLLRRHLKFCAFCSVERYGAGVY